MGDGIRKGVQCQMVSVSHVQPSDGFMLVSDPILEGYLVEAILYGDGFCLLCRILRENMSGVFKPALSRDLRLFVT